MPQGPKIMAGLERAHVSLKALLGLSAPSSEAWQQVIPGPEFAWTVYPA